MEPGREQRRARGISAAGIWGVLRVLCGLSVLIAVAVPSGANALGPGDGKLLRRMPDQMCHACHKTEKSAPNDTANSLKIHNSVNTMYDTTWGIPNSLYGEFTCTTCHTTHNTNNIYLIRDQIKAPDASQGKLPGEAAGNVVDFRMISGVSGSLGTMGDDTGTCKDQNGNSLGYATGKLCKDNGGTWAPSSTAAYSVCSLSQYKTQAECTANGGTWKPSTKVCQYCHSRNKFHNFDPTNNKEVHNNGSSACTQCHKHTGAFRVECGDCHGFPPLVNQQNDLPDVQGGVRNGLVNKKGSDSAANTGTGAVTAGRHFRHATEGPSTPADSQNYDCKVCHGQRSHNSKIKISFNFLNAAGLTGGRYTGRVLSNGFGYETDGSTTIYALGDAGNPDGGAAAPGMQCTAIYCHSNAQPLKDKNGSGPDLYYAKVTWDQAGNTVCTSCHGGANGALGGTVGGIGFGTTLSNPHQKHTNTTYNFPCSRCHAATVSSNSKINNRANHVNGIKDVFFSDAGTYNSSYSSPTCANVYCHSNAKQEDKDSGSVLSYASPKWTDVGPLACDSCHGRCTPKNDGTGKCSEPNGFFDTTNKIGFHTGYPNYPNGGAGGVRANSHYTHVALKNIVCDKCHSNTTVTTTDANRNITGIVIKQVSPRAHVNAKKDVNFDSQNISGSYLQSIKTCQSVACHGLTSSPTWGGTVTCGDCHLVNNTLAGKHSKHYDMSTNAADRTAKRNTNASTNKYAFNCGICHNETGVWNDPICSGISETDCRSRGGSWSYDGGQNDCTGLGTGAAGKAVCERTPTITHGAGWVSSGRTAEIVFDYGDYAFSGSTAATVAGAYTPGGGTPNQDPGTKYYYTEGSCTNIYCHSPGNRTTPNYDSPNKAVTWAAADTPIGCNGCHNYSSTSSISGTPTPMASGKHKRHVAGLVGGDGRENYTQTCDKCHYGTTTDGATITGKSQHVDKKKDVSFSYGLPNAGTYNRDTDKSCQNAYCHSQARRDDSDSTKWESPNIPVAWNDPDTKRLACYSCHKGRAYDNTQSSCQMVTACTLNKTACEATAHVEDSGNATGGSATTVVDAGKSWTVNQWTGYYVTAGGQAALPILSNTPDTLAVSGTFNPVIAGGNAYSILGHYGIWDSSAGKCKNLSQTDCQNAGGSMTFNNGNNNQWDEYCVGITDSSCMNRCTINGGNTMNSTNCSTLGGTYVSADSSCRNITQSVCINNPQNALNKVFTWSTIGGYIDTFCTGIASSATCTVTLGGEWYDNGNGTTACKKLSESTCENNGGTWYGPACRMISQSACETQGLGGIWDGSACRGIGEGLLNITQDFCSTWGGTWTDGTATCTGLAEGICRKLDGAYNGLTCRNLSGGVGSDNSCKTLGGAWMSNCNPYILTMSSNGHDRLVKKGWREYPCYYCHYDTIEPDKCSGGSLNGQYCVSNGGLWYGCNNLNITNSDDCSTAGGNWIGYACSNPQYTNQSDCEDSTKGNGIWIWYGCNIGTITDSKTCALNPAYTWFGCSVSPNSHYTQSQCRDAGGLWDDTSGCRRIIKSKCSAVSGTMDTNTRVKDKTKHADGTKTVRMAPMWYLDPVTEKGNPSYDSDKRVCNNVYCHSDGTKSAPVKNKNMSQQRCATLQNAAWDGQNKLCTGITEGVCRANGGTWVSGSSACIRSESDTCVQNNGGTWDSGTTDPLGGDPGVCNIPSETEVRSYAWDGGHKECNACHGHTPGSCSSTACHDGKSGRSYIEDWPADKKWWGAMPMYPSEGPDSARSNSHFKHLFTGFSCEACHVKTVAGACGSCHANGIPTTSGMAEIGHVKPEYHDNKIKDVYFSNTNSNQALYNLQGRGDYNSLIANKTCLNTSCHTNYTPRWGEKGSDINCLQCHAPQTNDGDADTDSNGTFDPVSGVRGRISIAQWNDSGHGRQTGTYKSGNPAANFPSNSNKCAYCHDNTVLHQDANNPVSDNPYRLRQHDQFKRRFMKECLYCHMTRTENECLCCHTDQRVDLYGDGKFVCNDNGLTESLAPQVTEDGIEYSDGSAKYGSAYVGPPGTNFVPHQFTSSCMNTGCHNSDMGQLTTIIDFDYTKHPATPIYANKGHGQIQDGQGWTKAMQADVRNAYVMAGVCLKCHDDDGSKCSNSSYKSEADCTSHSGTWDKGPECKGCHDAYGTGSDTMHELGFSPAGGHKGDPDFVYPVQARASSFHFGYKHYSEFAATGGWACSIADKNTCLSSSINGSWDTTTYLCDWHTECATLTGDSTNTATNAGVGWNSTSKTCAKSTESLTQAMCDTLVNGLAGTMANRGTTKGGKFCWDCHDPHGDTNLYMIHDKVTTVSDGKFGRPISYGQVTFTKLDGAKLTGTNYVKSDGSGICNICHTQTNHYKGASGDTHNNQRRCTECHEHRFTNSHSSGVACNTCHKNKPVPRNSAFGLPRDCTKCHNGTISARIDVISQLSISNSHHIQGVDLNNKYCYSCHWEATSIGLINTDYHQGYNFKTHTGTSAQAVDLAVWQSGGAGRCSNSQYNSDQNSCTTHGGTWASCSNSGYATQSACTSAGYTWYPTVGQRPTDYILSQCNNHSYDSDQTTCEGNGGIWTGCANTSFTTQSTCVNAGYTWYPVPSVSRFDTAAMKSAQSNANQGNLATLATERTQAGKVSAACVGCHSDQNNDANPFNYCSNPEYLNQATCTAAGYTWNGDFKVPRQYAWDRSSISARYFNTGTTKWGKYTSYNGAAPKNIVKAFSAHGNVANNGGYDMTGCTPSDVTGAGFTAFDQTSCQTAGGTWIGGACRNISQQACITACCKDSGNHTTCDNTGTDSTFCGQKTGTWVTTTINGVSKSTCRNISTSTNCTNGIGPNGIYFSNAGTWSQGLGNDGALTTTRGTGDGLTVYRVECFDCHNSHGSLAGGVTSSYTTFNGSRNGANLKEAKQNKGGYAVNYKAVSNVCSGNSSDSTLTDPVSCGAKGFVWWGSDTCTKPICSLSGYTSQGTCQTAGGTWYSDPAYRRYTVQSDSCNVLPTVYTTQTFCTSNGGIWMPGCTNNGGAWVAGTANQVNPYAAGSSQCFDCHESKSKGTATFGGNNTPWGYYDTFGAAAQIRGYRDTPKFAASSQKGSKVKWPFKKPVDNTANSGGHLKRSLLGTSSLGHNPMTAINGLCTPCHDPHGVSPVLSDNEKPYAVPLLKGTWLTSPYKEDAPPDNSWVGGRNYNSYYAAQNLAYSIDQNAFASWTWSSKLKISESPDLFGGLCIKCHPQNALTVTGSTTLNGSAISTGTMTATTGSTTQLTDSTKSWVSGQFANNYYLFMNSGANAGKYRKILSSGATTITVSAAFSSNISNGDSYTISGAWQTVSRIHNTVKGWGGNGQNAGNSIHAYPCSKCHQPHVSGLPRLMATNCVDYNHKGKVTSGGVPVRYYPGNAGYNASGTFPSGGQGNHSNGLHGFQGGYANSIFCHDSTTDQVSGGWNAQGLVPSGVPGRNGQGGVNQLWNIRTPW